MREYLARYLWWRVAQLLDSECDRVDRCSEYDEDSASAVESEGCRRAVGPEKVNQQRPPAVSVEDRWAARDAIRHLREEDAEVVYFYYWEGNTQAEIASKAGRTQAWVSRSLSRSIKKLGTILHK
jgi:RNA polymerase sigma factor (sigma-70 family)